MKISAYYKAMGDQVEFADMFGHYDIIYKSKVFSWTADNITAYDCDEYIEGGTGYNFNNLPEMMNDMCPDYSLYNCKHAYGFLTRGCIRNCEWCIVPEKEGKIRAENDIQDFIADKKSAILIDNNVLASEHGIKQIKKIIDLGISIDFNQGLDARLIDDYTAYLLSKVKWLSPLRMACDSQAMKKPVRRAINLLIKHNCKPKNYFIYTLVKDIDESLDRIEFLKALHVDPFAQAYRNFKNTEPTWEQKRLCRWVNHKAIFKSIEWENYKK
jgi:hypothetical protein